MTKEALLARLGEGEMRDLLGGPTRTLLPLLLLLTSCAGTSMTEYPGARRALSEIQRGNYELCETGRTAINPNRGEQHLACYAMADNYRPGTPGWVRYMAVSCNQSYPLACNALAQVAMGADAPSGYLVGDWAPMPPPLREEALRGGLDACQRGPMLQPAGEAGTPQDTNGATCAFSAVVLRAMHPERRAEALAVLKRGCRHYASGTACALFEREGGQVDEASAERMRQGFEHDAERARVQHLEERRELNAIAEQGAADDRRRHEEQIRASQQPFGASAPPVAPGSGVPPMASARPEAAETCQPCGECDDYKRGCGSTQRDCYLAAACLCRCNLRQKCGGTPQALQACVTENEKHARSLQSRPVAAGEGRRPPPNEPDQPKRKPTRSDHNSQVAR
jgi:hypothetical protein